MPGPICSASTGLATGLGNVSFSEPVRRPHGWHPATVLSLEVVMSLFRASDRAAQKSPKRLVALHLESLEDRLVLNSSSFLPRIAVPPAGVVAVSLNDQNDAKGTASITSGENDFYRFTAQTTGV